MKYTKNFVVKSLENIGGFSILLYQTIISSPTIFRRGYLFTQQIIFMGIGSLTIVILTSIFTGMVTALQAFAQVSKYMPVVYIGMSVARAEFIELGPMLTGLIITGRVCSSIAAELGTMVVTEQVDALESMAINPVEYLVVPRVAASTFVLPLLTIVSEGFAILGGLVFSYFALHVPAALYLRGVRLHYHPIELWGGLIKAATFGLIIGITGCYNGLRAKGGAEGVGKATTNAVVASSVLILVADYVVARIIFH